MEIDPVVPVLTTLFVCVAYSIKSVVDARARSKLVAGNRPDELIQSILINEERRRRHGALRWGIVISSLAVAFALIQLFGWREVTPGVIAVLLGAMGVGNVASYFVARKLDEQRSAVSTIAG